MFATDSIWAPARFGQTNPRPAPRAPEDGYWGELSVCCVHFTADRREHSMWYADEGPDGDDAGCERFSALWRATEDGVLQSELTHVREIVCDCLLLTTPWDLRHVPLGEGVPRKFASALSRIRQRPLLATFARRVEFPPDVVRRFHRLLLSAALAVPV